MRATNEIHTLILKHKDHHYKRDHFVLQDETRWFRKSVIPRQTGDFGYISWAEVTKDKAETLEQVYQQYQPTV